MQLILNKKMINKEEILKLLNSFHCSKLNLEDDLICLMSAETARQVDGSSTLLLRECVDNSKSRVMGLEKIITDLIMHECCKKNKVSDFFSVAKFQDGSHDIVSESGIRLRADGFGSINLINEWDEVVVYRPSIHDMNCPAKLEEIGNGTA